MENPCRIITFGDSITKSYTHIFRKQIVEEYREINLEVVNAGVVGDTSTHGLIKLPQIIEQKPNVVIVGFGMNDWRKGVSLEFFRQNLRAIVDGLEKHSVRVLLVTINPDYQGLLKGTSRIIDKYNMAIKNVAHEKRIRVVDVNSLWKREIRPIQKGLADPVHPNKIGYGIICKSLLRIVPRRTTRIIWQFSGEHCACNYKCPYCYVPSDVNVGEHFIGTIDKWHEGFRKSFRNQHLSIYASFGEPIIQQHFYEVVEMIESEPNWEMIMTSNISISLPKLLKSRLIKEGRLNINASFHPTETSIDNFLKQLLVLRENGIECTVTFVMYPPLMKDFPHYFEIFTQNNFLVHVRRFRAYYQGKYYPEAYTEKERQFVAKYMDNASIKYMLMDINMKGKLSYAGMFYILVTNKGDIALCPDYTKEFRRGNILNGTINLDIEPEPLPDVNDGTVEGVASLLETGYHELEGNHVLAFARQGGIYHTKEGVHYPHIHTDFNDPSVREKFSFPGS